LEDNKESVDVAILLDITRKKLIVETLRNTELEALVSELKNKISELEAK
jgi:hypothetical protein